MELLTALNWRYSTKRMTGEKLDQALVDQILEAARLAPTAAGLQPFKIISITDAATKKAVSRMAFNQPQIIECSHLLVFVSWDAWSDRLFAPVDAYACGPAAQPAQAGTQPALQTAAGFTQEQQRHQSAKQRHMAIGIGIGMGFALACAAVLGVDSTPMEGFDKEALDQYLALDKCGLHCVALMALGRRDPVNDWLLPLKKACMPREEFVIEKT